MSENKEVKAENEELRKELQEKVSSVLKNINVEVALNKCAKKSSDIVISEFFIKDNSEEYIFKNLNATCQLLEKESSKLLKQLVTQNNNTKLTLKQFHKVLIQVLNQ